MKKKKKRMDGERRSRKEEEEEGKREREEEVRNWGDYYVWAWFKFFGRKEASTTRFDTAQTDDLE